MRTIEPYPSTPGTLFCFHAREGHYTLTLRQIPASLTLKEFYLHCCDLGRLLGCYRAVHVSPWEMIDDIYTLVESMELRRKFQLGNSNAHTNGWWFKALHPTYGVVVGSVSFNPEDINHFTTKTVTVAELTPE